jgi:hypothetical protein
MRDDQVLFSIDSGLHVVADDGRAPLLTSGVLLELLPP